ncbi:glycosyltransferase [Congregibacter variabilis]|uniref:Glycosyltransferase n=1 Tax=Congregibacter variabilis TaxID=3081200 RepID=A0ABZ0I2R4_9GAMM|nr:glycosyltransferase [Congregibacter sp. IMCC43200]
MNIVMLTNTFTPHVGGVARSVAAFTAAYRRRGHRVLVVAPEFANMPEHETDVLRIPAIQHFNGSDFSMVLPVSGLLSDVLDEFEPQMLHAHHPYLLGATALRIARFRQCPLVYTHHTLIEQYTHYVPVDSPAVQRFAIEMGTRYANMADQVFAPSQSIAALLKQRGVHVPIAVLPTGVDTAHYAQGDGAGFRTRLGIGQNAFVIGHLGRLAPEKNLEFLAKAIALSMHSNTEMQFLLAGDGPSVPTIKNIFEIHGVLDRVHFLGVLDFQKQVAAYHAMNLFAFASTSETQGMVLTEAMAAGIPVVALDASGVREVVNDGHNGRLVFEATPAAFAEAIQSVASLSEDDLQKMQAAARATAQEFSMDRHADRAIAIYSSLIRAPYNANPHDVDTWESVLRLFRAEWEMTKNVVAATGVALGKQNLLR